MKIVEARTHELRIPIETGGPHGWGSNEWKEPPFTLLGITTDSGLLGWGDGCCYGKAKRTATSLREIIASQLLGLEARHITAIPDVLLRDRVPTGPFLHAISAVDYVLPGVTKMGGLTTARRVLALAEARNVSAIPWTPIHGPGLLASVHPIATLPKAMPVAFFDYTSIDGLLYGDALTPSNGFLTAPQGPGLGHDPGPEVVRRFAV